MARSRAPTVSKAIAASHATAAGVLLVAMRFSKSASPSTARLLNVEVGTPLLKIQRHAFVARSMVDYSVSYYRADRYKLWVPLQRPGARPARNQSLGYRNY